MSMIYLIKKLCILLMPLPSKKCKNSIDKVYEKCSDDDQYVLGEGCSILTTFLQPETTRVV